MEQKQLDFLEDQAKKIAEQEGFVDFNVDILTIPNKYNFTTIISEIKIKGLDRNGQEIELNLISKTLRLDPEYIESFDLYNVFKREVFMYTKIFPEFEAMQKEKIPYIPRVYYAIFDRTNEQYLLILENIYLKNYQMCPIQDLMDLDHFKQTLNAVAHFHAFSYVLRDQNPDYLDYIKMNLKDQFVARIEKRGSTTEFFSHSSFQYVIDQLEEMEPENVAFIEKSKKVFKNLTKLMRKSVDTVNCEPFGVLNHGDLHLKNFMFQYNLNGKPETISLLDWQLSRFASPANDLCFLIFILTTKSFRDQYYNELIEFYYQKLIKYISKFGSNAEKLISLKEIHRQIRKYGQFGVLFAPGVILWNQIDSNVFGEIFDETIESIHMRKNPFTSIEHTKKTKQRVIDLLKDAFKYGILTDE